jgi:hypothetical protein
VCPELTYAGNPRTAAGTTAGATDDSSGTCGGAGASDVTAQFTAPFQGRYVFDDAGTTFEGVLYVTDGCGGPELGCSDVNGNGADLVVLDLLAGQQVVAVMDGADATQAGAFTLTTRPVPPAELSCADGNDEDFDGVTDCADTADCAADPACALPPEICDNNADDDGDGASDCADADCVAAPSCVPEADCANGVDDDLDLATDCADADCAADPACAAGVETSCTDGLDTDGDGATDCADADCAADAACLGVCPEATLVPGTGVYGDTTGLTNDYAPSCPFSTNAGDFSVEFTAPFAGDWGFTLSGSSYDTVLAAYTDCTGAVELACNDDADGVQSQIVVTMAANDTVLLAVDGYSTAEGGFVLNAGLTNAAAPELSCADHVDNDLDDDFDCQDADCTGNPACVEDCTDGFDNDGDFATDCADADCAAEPQCVENCTDGLDNDADFATDCADADCAADPACIAPCPEFVLSNVLPSVAFGNTAGATNDFTPSCTGSTASDHSYEFTAPAAGYYTFDTNGSLYDTALMVFDGCGGPELDCDDDGGIGTQSMISGLFLNAGQTVIVVVDGYSSNSGAYTLNAY